ncbi:hypothetical protein AncyloWKF20_09460 [Ancylobacter sp. WKF20]|uniref:hypothetical protein n=1 Tax=Ancylobacter sp. WKF20 TaxID=3039801 RepID=UPI0024342DEC|nr:hypothetical protein [Ancylobacter sp. WKF20]WGD32019.1 hypothetical protein AncyloWKF20_09460 [Ancylobacter sp. WKF20]
MGRWTARLLQPEKIHDTHERSTDKTDETSTQVGFVSSVSASVERIQNFSVPERAEAAGGSVSFVSDPSERFRVFSLDRSGWDGEDWQATYEERAAILEHDEGLPRAEAEQLAREHVIQLMQSSV